MRFSPNRYKIIISFTVTLCIFMFSLLAECWPSCLGLGIIYALLIGAFVYFLWSVFEN